MRKLTHEEWINRHGYKFSETIKIIGRYDGCSNPIECECLICNTNYITMPDIIVQGCGHYQCSMDSNGKINSLKSKETFIERLKDINDKITTLDEYERANKKIKCFCNVCNNIWSVTPNKLLSGRGCPRCSKKSANKKKTQSKDVFIKRLYNISPNIKLIGKYTNTCTKTRFKCLLDTYEWDTTPFSLLKGHGCPECFRTNSMNTHEEFLIKLKERNYHNITIVSKYDGICETIYAKCNDCGNIFESTPHNLYHNVGCPICNLTVGETSIREYLESNNVQYDMQVRYDDLLGINNGKLSYDFYIPTYNLLIEYQGEFHDGTARQQSDEEYKIQQEHDRRKKDYAEENNIKLLEIWYWDFNNIEKILNKKLNINNFKSA